METLISVDTATCIGCGHCVKTCSPGLFVQSGAKAPVELRNTENCIRCGHCVAVCPVGAVGHADFPADTVHPIDYAARPTPEQVELLLRSRRSNRAFTPEPVPEALLERIVGAADRAPTASNARQLGYVLVTDAEVRRQVIEFTLGVFDKIVRLLTNVFVRPWLRRVSPEKYRYVPSFKHARRVYDEHGVDRILRGASAVLFIHAPRTSRFGVEDANLAYQNASLMAETLGVSQVYMGLVTMAARQDARGLNRILGLGNDRRVRAIMALGMPQFRYPNSIDRKKAVLTKK